MGRSLAACPGSGVKLGPSRMAATQGARGYATSLVSVENAGIGRLCAEELRSKLHQDRAGSSLGRHQGYGSACSPEESSLG